MKFEVWKDIVSQSSYFKSRLDPVTLGGVGGETGTLGKCENWGIFILRIGDRIFET